MRILLLVIFIWGCSEDPSTNQGSRVRIPERENPQTLVDSFLLNNENVISPEDYQKILKESEKNATQLQVGDQYSQVESSFKKLRVTDKEKGMKTLDCLVRKKFDYRVLEINKDEVRLEAKIKQTYKPIECTPVERTYAENITTKISLSQHKKSLFSQIEKLSQKVTTLGSFKGRNFIKIDGREIIDGQITEHIFIIDPKRDPFGFLVQRKTYKGSSWRILQTSSLLRN